MRCASGRRSRSRRSSARRGCGRAAAPADRYFESSLRGFKSRLAKGADDPFTRYYIACLHALLGNTDKALDSLERSFKALAPINRVRAPIDPDLESLRGEPRFTALLA